jgi:hypothetical protein
MAVKEFDKTKQPKTSNPGTAQNGKRTTQASVKPTKMYGTKVRSK